MNENRKIDELELREWIFKRYPNDHIADVDFNESHTMAYVLLFSNGFCVDRIVIDRDEDGCLGVWKMYTCDWNQIYERED